MPSNGVLKLTGHGYGHGHGMSQYGARGAASKGLTHRQILAFYYPGTSVATIGGTIRVLITADTDNDVRVVPASGLRVREMGSSPSYAPADACQDDDLAAADSRRQDGPGLLQRQLAHLQARRQGTQR